MANYDPTNKLEVLLKEIVNILKDILKDIAGLPVLGPILGPSEFSIFLGSFPSEARSSRLQYKMRHRLGA